MKSYADAIEGKQGGEMPVFGQALGERNPLQRAEDIAAINSVGQVLRWMRAQNWPVPRIGSTRPEYLLLPSSVAPSSTVMTNSRRGRMLANVRQGAQQTAPDSASAVASSADPSGAAARFLGKVDAAVDTMFNDEFVRRWEAVSQSASSSAELLVMRLYMTTPTNWYQSMLPWLTNDVRVPLNFFVLRTLRCRTNPVIRVKPGADTMFLARSFERTLEGTEQGTGIFSLNHSYYSGVIIVQHHNIQVYNGVAPHGYLSGMGSQWADFARRVPGMVSVLAPGSAIPIAFSPVGNVGVEAPQGADLQEAVTGAQSIARFEMVRQNMPRGPFVAERHPDNKYGAPIESAVHKYWSRDTTLIAGPQCDFRKHVPSAGLLPTRWATEDLRTVLDGNGVEVSMPLKLQSNDQIGQRV